MSIVINWYCIDLIRYHQKGGVKGCWTKYTKKDLSTLVYNLRCIAIFNFCSCCSQVREYLKKDYWEVYKNQGKTGSKLFDDMVRQFIKLQDSNNNGKINVKEFIKPWQDDIQRRVNKIRDEL